MNTKIIIILTLLLLSIYVLKAQQKSEGSRATYPQPQRTTGSVRTGNEIMLE